MTVAYVRAGTSAATASSTTLSCPYPSTVDADDLLIIAAGVKDETITFTNLSGLWTAWVQHTGGTGTNGADTGPTRVAASWLTAVGTEDGGNETVTVASTPSPLIVNMLEFSKTGATWDIASAQGDDTSTGSTYSVTFGTDPGFAAGDVALVVISGSTDSGTFTLPTLTIPGCTVDTPVEQVTPSSSLGNDGRIRAFTAAVTLGTSTTFATFAATVSISTAGCGPARLIRLRETSALTVSPTGIASAEAFGTPVVTTGPVTVSPSGIGSGEAFGTPVITVTVSPTGIASAEAFGTPVITVGSATVTPTGIPSAQAFGTPVVTVGPATVSPDSIASGQAFGTPVVTVGSATVTPTGIASAETFGTPQVSTGSLFTTPNVLILPNVEKSTPRWQRQHMRHYAPKAVGKTLLKIGGVWTDTLNPTTDQIAAATVVFHGGHDYYIDDAMRDELIAAGYLGDVGPFTHAAMAVFTHDELAVFTHSLLGTGS